MPMFLRTAAVLSAPLVLLACGGDKGLTSESQPTNGELQLTIARAAASQVPSAADSAFVRVWHPSAGTNQVKQVLIPDPGSTTTVSFVVPARTGYSVGVIAYRFNAAINVREALAGGRADAVSVLSDQTTDVQLDVVPWSVTLTGPDTLVSGEQATFGGTFTQGPSVDFFVSGFIHFDITPWTDLSALPPANASYSVNQSGFSVTFNAPTVEADTTVWMQFDFRANGNDWQSTNFALIAFLPSITLAEALVTRPVLLGSGSITVTF